MSGLFDTPSPVAAPEPTSPAASYRVLARKYRPTHLKDLIGQEAMVQTLRNAFATGRLASAFMLSGVRGVGKTSTARIIARALNCIGPDGKGGPTADPCGVCPNCRAILAERHPDVVEMDAASRTGVDDVREIIEAVRFRPLEAREKVFIIDEVHMLSRNAFNALLKTLEEPPAHVTFVFATTEVRKVPLTVLSRCQRFDLRRLDVAALAQHFGRIATAESAAIAPDALTLIARASDGSVRDGLSLLDQAITLRAGEGPIDAQTVTTMLGMADREVPFDLLEALFAGKPAAALAVADKEHARGTDPGLLLADLMELLHTLGRLKAIPELKQSPELSEAERTRGAMLAEKLSVPILGRAWQMLLKGTKEVESAPNRRAAADMVLIRLCYVADLPPPAELVRTLSTAGPSPARSPLPLGEGSGVSASSSPLPRGEGAGVRAAPAATVAPHPLPKDFPAVVRLAAEAREPILAAELRHHAHLVRFAPPVIEIRPEAKAPRDLAARLARTLQGATGIRWTIALSADRGAPTLAATEAAEDASRRAEAVRHPLVAAILAAFPGAEIGPVRAIDPASRASASSAADAPAEQREEDRI